MTGDGGTTKDELTPAMARWRARLAAGYSIQPVIARSSYRGTVWRPGLFNADGAWVQNVRWDTLRKLVELGLVRDEIPSSEE